MRMILQTAIDMATALELEGHATRGHTVDGMPPSADNPLLCHGTLPEDCSGCKALRTWRHMRAQRCQRCQQPRPRQHGSVPCKGAVFEPLRECGEIVYRWRGDPPYRCIGPKGVAHSHADPRPEHMGQVLYDFRLAGAWPSSVYQLHPLTDAAREWVEANVSHGGFHPDWPTLVIEARYVDGLIEGIIGDDLAVKRGQ